MKKQHKLFPSPRCSTECVLDLRSGSSADDRPFMTSLLLLNVFLLTTSEKQLKLVTDNCSTLAYELKSLSSGH